MGKTTCELLLEYIKQLYLSGRGPHVDYLKTLMICPLHCQTYLEFYKFSIIKVGTIPDVGGGDQGWMSASVLDTTLTNNLGANDLVGPRLDSVRV